MAKDDMVDADLPSRDAAKEFYAKYEPKEALGRWGELFYTPLTPHSPSLFNIDRCISSCHQNQNALREFGDQIAVKLKCRYHNCTKYLSRILQAVF